MNDNDLYIGLLGAALALLLLLGMPYGAYKYGRFAERRLLTEAFMKTMEQDYSVGYTSGFKDGKAQGLVTGRALGRMEILAEEDDGRY